MSKNIKSVAFYVTIILVFGSLMYLVAKEGESQQITNAISSSYDSPKNLSEGFVLFRGLLLENIKSSLWQELSSAHLSWVIFLQRHPPSCSLLSHWETLQY